MNIDGDTSCTLNFMNSPPEYMHLKCPVCFNLLLDPPPQLVSCCGNHFCSNCIESLKDRPCPLCKKTDFQHMPDLNHSRALKALQIYCTYQPSCTWKGDLEGLVSHLSKEGDCQYAQLPCKHECGASIVRSELLEHEDEQCPKRPFICEHCREYSSTRDDVTTVHYGTCDQVPVECPNKCGGTMARASVDEHRNAKCPLEVVECVASRFSCSWKGERKDLDDHMKQGWKEHFMLIMSSHSKSIEELSAKLDEKSDMILGLQREIVELTSRVVELEHDRKEDTCAINSTKRASIPESSGMLHVPLGLKFHLNGYSYIREQGSMATHMIYLGKNSYRVYLEVYPNGEGKSKGSFMSVFFRIMQGPNDAKLIWPFRGSITIAVGKLTANLQTEGYPDQCFVRPTGGSRNQKWGLEAFMSHSAVQKLLNNDVLLIKFVSALVPTPVR